MLHRGSNYSLCSADHFWAAQCAAVSLGHANGATEIAGLDIVGPVWQGWTMTDDLRTGVICLAINVVDQ